MKKILLISLFFTFYSLSENKNFVKKLEITSDNLEYQKNLILLNSNIVAKTKFYTIYADELKGFSNQKTGKLDRIEFRKNIIINYQNSKAYAQLAFYLPKKQKIILTKKPKIIQKDNIFEAKKIILYENKQQILFFEPKITFLLKKKEITNKSFTKKK